MSDRSTVVASAVTTTLVIALFVGLAALGGGNAAAVHPDDAQDVTEEANFTINFPYATDHYPGDENEGNGSIQYFAVGEDAFHEMGASDGIYYDWIIVHATYGGEDWIDYSECTIDNTAAFGIDRGNDESGTNFDDDLTLHRKDSTFRDDGIVVEFFSWDDPGGNPPYMAPEDAIVAAQGAGSVSGPCLTLTEDPGWYRIAAFANATVNDNDPDEEPTEDAEYVRFQLDSTYEYVCMCDSEEEAREQLGPPPNEPGGEPTPTDTSDDGSTDDGSSDDGSTDDGSSDDGSTDDGSSDDGSADDGSSDDGSGDDSADDGSGDDDSGDDSADDDGGDDGSDDTGDDAGDDNSTPAADGPGFGALAALVALLAAALLVTRRR